MTAFDYTTAVLARAPLLYWRLGDRAGAVVDSSGNGRDGVVQAAPARGVAGALRGDSDLAMSFSGALDFVQSSYNPFAQGSARTYVGWLYPTAITGTRCVWGRAGQDGLWMSGGVFRWRCAAVDEVWANAPLPINDWTFVAHVVDQAADTSELFLDGVSQGVKVNANDYAALATNFSAGQSLGGFFAGRLDDVAIFGAALEADDVAELFDIGEETRWRARFPTATFTPKAGLDASLDGSFGVGPGGRFFDLADAIRAGEVKTADPDLKTFLRGSGFFDEA